MPFPRPLRWALLAPFVAFAAMYLAAMSGVRLGADPAFRILGIVLWLGGAVTELIAVPIALYLLLRGGSHLTWGNATLTALGAIPLVAVAMIVFILEFGHFHI